MSQCIKDIEKICGSGVATGGIGSTLTIICPEDVNKYPLQNCSTTLIGDLELIPTTRTFTFNIRPRSGTFVERQRNNQKSGDFFFKELSFSIPKDRPEVADTVQGLTNQKVHVIYSDKHQNRKIVFGLRASSDFTTGGRRNEYTFKLTAQSRRKSAFFNGNII